MIDVVTEILIVFQDFIFGKKKKTNGKVRPTTIIVLIVLVTIITTLIIYLYPLLNEN